MPLSHDWGAMELLSSKADNRHGDPNDISGLTYEHYWCTTSAGVNPGKSPHKARPSPSRKCTQQRLPTSDVDTLTQVVFFIHRMNTVTLSLSLS
ncbi:hypothetical protein VNO78_21496 [Psophocarpus tetragonolobus]|uniref:Uncharacterized protein n=1 Tax=Psophocarpus tetragonolobus TaxID=3891 RepID=A0AAN9SC85_PSOTE